MRRARPATARTEAALAGVHPEAGSNIVDSKAPRGVPVLCLPGSHDAPDLMAQLPSTGSFQYYGRAD
jgi:hypothetical protein